MQAFYDVAVIGAGPGGLLAALRTAEHGLKTLIFEAGKNPDDGGPRLGGTCANVGCIPSKALLAASLAYAKVKNGQPMFGIAASDAPVDMAAVQKHRAKVVKDSNMGVAGMFKAAGVDMEPVRAFFKGKGEKGWILETADGRTVQAQNVVLACGTEPRVLPGITLDEEVICSNTGALSWVKVPETLGIIGAGVIGLELGSVWSRYGAQVTILDLAETILPFAGKDVSQAAQKSLTAQGLELQLGVKIASVQKLEAGVTVAYERNGQAVTRTFEKLLVAVGRRSAVDSVNPEAVGLVVAPSGIVETDDEGRTNLPGVWALGDIVKGPQLAHKAMEEGRAVGDRIAGKTHPAGLSPVPSIVYTHPEFAWVGMTAEAAKTKGLTVSTGKAAFAHNGMARAMNATEGFVEIVCEEPSGRLIGAQAVGDAAGEIISSLTQAMAYGATHEDLSLVIWPHPAMSESIGDAALACLKASSKTRG